MIDADFSQPMQVDQPIGAAFIMRRSDWDRFGGMDEAYFLWFEEVDLAKRVSDAGAPPCTGPRSVFAIPAAPRSPVWLRASANESGTAAPSGTRIGIRPSWCGRRQADTPAGDHDELGSRPRALDASGRPERAMIARAIRGEPPANVARLAVPVLVAVSGLTIIALTALLLLDAPRPIVSVLQVVLIAAFLGLALLDLRAAVAIAMLELAVAGASGQWTRFPGGISGRVALDMTVALAGAIWLLRDWRRHGRLELGRYGAHALGIAVLLPLIWMPIGLLNGNLPRDVVADGNGHLFLAFSLACIALIRQGHGAWLRHWLLVVCAANAIVTLTMIVAILAGVVPLRTLADILYGDLLAGNVIGFQSNGAFRFFLASGLYLQVGLALVAWRLMQQPEIGPDWILYAILLIDVTATYTRGFWIGSVLALAVVLVLGSASWRRAAMVVGGSAAVFVLGHGDRRAVRLLGARLRVPASAVDHRYRAAANAPSQTRRRRSELGGISADKAGRSRTRSAFTRHRC